MDAITAIPQNAEQKRVIEAFLKALNIDYVSTKTTLEDLESRLLPNQAKVWKSLKRALLDVESGKAKGRTWTKFKKQLSDENTTA